MQSRRPIYIARGLSRLFAAARQRSFGAERLSERRLHSSQRKAGDHVGEKTLSALHHVLDVFGHLHPGVHALLID
jgi:hypothetical protein